MDPVVNTAYLTLVGKMGYRGKLLALTRLESYAFSVECDDPSSTLGRLRRFLSTQSTFYNRNKHNYFLDCHWDGEQHTEGAPADVLQPMISQIKRWAEVDKGQDLDGNPAPDRVILTRAPIYQSEVLVEDIDTAVKRSLAKKLEVELAARPVKVFELGIRWYLALGVESDEEAKRVTAEITVTESRNSGLLLNPNYQRYKLLSLDPIEIE
jgi:hypothetical protein